MVLRDVGLTRPGALSAIHGLLWWTGFAHLAVWPYYLKRTLKTLVAMIVRRIRGFANLNLAFSSQTLGQIRDKWVTPPRNAPARVACCFYVHFDACRTLAPTTQARSTLSPNSYDSLDFDNNILDSQERQFPMSSRRSRTSFADR